MFLLPEGDEASKAEPPSICRGPSRLSRRGGRCGRSRGTVPSHIGLWSLRGQARHKQSIAASSAEAPMSPSLVAAPSASTPGQPTNSPPGAKDAGARRTGNQPAPPPPRSRERGGHEILTAVVVDAKATVEEVVLGLAAQAQPYFAASSHLYPWSPVLVWGLASQRPSPLEERAHTSRYAPSTPGPELRPHRARGLDSCAPLRASPKAARPPWPRVRLRPDAHVTATRPPSVRSGQPHRLRGPARPGGPRGRRFGGNRPCRCRGRAMRARRRGGRTP